MIYEFLNGTLPDFKGRYLEDILRLSDEELEYQHDYIQVLFPLYEASLFNKDAPLLDVQEERAIKKHIEARKGLNRATDRMIKFYKNNDHWLTQYNHNQLRITRILKSVSILLCEDRSTQFFNFIIRRCNRYGFIIPDKTLKYWDYAVLGQDPPDIPKDYCVLSDKISIDEWLSYFNSREY